MKIIKRSGEEQDFDRAKIVTAISKANKTINADNRLTEPQIVRISEIIEAYGNTLPRPMSDEEIQDQVETEIMKLGAFDLAKEYIKYRFQRSLIRRANTTDRQHSGKPA